MLRITRMGNRPRPQTTKTTGWQHSQCNHMRPMYTTKPAPRVDPSATFMGHTNITDGTFNSSCLPTGFTELLLPQGHLCQLGWFIHLGLRSGVLARTPLTSTFRTVEAVATGAGLVNTPSA